MSIDGELSANFKRTVCKFWREGRCDKGQQCTWSHGDEDAAPLEAAPPWAMWSGSGAFGPERRPEVKRTLCRFFERGACERGERCTWAHGVEELGTLAAPGLEAGEELAPSAASGQPGAEVFADAPCSILKTICKFWQEGRCKNGDICSWAHGEHELGTPWPRQSPDAAAVLALSRALIEARPSMEEALGGVKRTICKFWLEGKCRNGDLCTWAHGELELGTPAPVTDGVHAAPGWDGRQRSICRSWQQGLCERGNQCIFAHAQEAVGLSGGGPFGCAGGGPGGPFRGLAGGFGGGAALGSRAPARAGAALPALGGGWGPAEAERPLKRTLCRFWQQGLCERGDQCTWLHGEADAGAAAPQLSWAWPLGGGRPAPARDGGLGALALRRSICKFWQEGTCSKPEGQCTWAHGEQELGTAVSAEPREPCRFFLSGACQKGNLCAFPHIMTTEEVIPPWKRPRVS